MWKLLLKLLISFITTISAFVPILIFVGIDDYSKLVLLIESNNTVPIIVISICIFIGFSIGGYIHESNKTQLKAEKMHAIFHDLRDNGLRDNSTIDHTTRNIFDFINKISTQKFNVCIKTFNFEESKCYDNYDSIKELELKTLSRASVNGDRKDDSKKHIVNNNTDFRSILFKEECNIYACSNLIMYRVLNEILNPDMQYENSDTKYYKKYLASIVIPIRINKEKIAKSYENCKCICYNSYITIGFLCIDTKLPISGSLKREISGAAKAIADSMFYPLFDFYNKDNK